MHSVFREPINGLTHLGGAVFSIVALCILSAQAAMHGTVIHMVAFMIFGATMLLLFLSSAIYHLLHAPDHVIFWLRRIDHMTIFLLIAGSYTPFCLIPLYGPVGLTMLVSIWTLAAAGVLMKIFWMSAPMWFSTLIYLGMGWLVVFAYGPAMEHIPEAALQWLFWGGIAYSVGAVIFVTRWPDPWPRWFGHHEIWHVFVLVGAYCHFHAIAFHLADLPVGY